MPGIVGIVSQSPPEECQSLVRAMVRSMEHESFYQSGTSFVPEMGIYAGWVAIAGSFAAGRALTHQNEDVALLFAGECFQDSGSDNELGPQTDSSCRRRTDWLLRLYEKEGEQFFTKLNGLFSGLLIDKRRNSAFLFNDRYGSERIYFCETKGGLYFASEAKALLRILPETRAFNEESVAQFFTFGCTVGWQSLFRGVEVLPGGSLWTFERQSVRKGRYFLPAIWESQPQLSEEIFEAEFEKKFRRILLRYLDPEGQIGLSLTGGLDTRMIVACLPENTRKPLGYTFLGEKAETLDARLAAKVAKACGMKHQKLRIGADFFSNFASYADRTVYATDGCFGVLGAHEIYFNEQARRLAPVRLTGVFGSEILRGMSTFKPMGLAPDLFNPEFNLLVKAAAQKLSGPEDHPVTFAAFKEHPWNIFGSLSACRSQVTFRTPYLDNEIVALAYQAPDHLRKSTRTALRLVMHSDPALAEIPTDRARIEGVAGFSRHLKRAFSEMTFKFDYLYNEGMPNSLVRLDPIFSFLNSRVAIFGRHKYLHYRRWFRNELASYLKSVITDAQTGDSPFWNLAFIDRLHREHTGGQKNYIREINAVLSLQAVERLLIRNHPKE